MTTREMLQMSMPSDRELQWTRVFDAPRHLVFDAMTKPEYIRRWLLGPDGWVMIVCEVDLRVGGSFRYVWSHEKKGEMGMGGVYREIAKPERIVNTEVFDDPWYNGEGLATIVLVEHAGKTTVTTTMLCDSKEVRDGVLKSGMEEGMLASYNRLAEVLSTISAGGEK